MKLFQIAVILLLVNQNAIASIPEDYLPQVACMGSLHKILNFSWATPVSQDSDEGVVLQGPREGAEGVWAFTKEDAFFKPFPELPQGIEPDSVMAKFNFQNPGKKEYFYQWDARITSFHQKQSPFKPLNPLAQNSSVVAISLHKNDCLDEEASKFLNGKVRSALEMADFKKAVTSKAVGTTGAQLARGLFWECQKVKEPMIARLVEKHYRDFGYTYFHSTQGTTAPPKRKSTTITR